MRAGVFYRTVQIVITTLGVAMFVGACSGAKDAPAEKPVAGPAIRHPLTEEPWCELEKTESLTLAHRWRFFVDTKNRATVLHDRLVKTATDAWQTYRAPGAKTWSPSSSAEVTAQMGPDPLHLKEREPLRRQTQVASEVFGPSPGFTPHRSALIREGARAATLFPCADYSPKLLESNNPRPFAELSLRLLAEKSPTIEEDNRALLGRLKILFPLQVFAVNRLVLKHDWCSWQWRSGHLESQILAVDQGAVLANFSDTQIHSRRQRDELRKELTSQIASVPKAEWKIAKNGQLKFLNHRFQFVRDARGQSFLVRTNEETQLSDLFVSCRDLRPIDRHRGFTEHLSFLTQQVRARALNSPPTP